MVKFPSIKMFNIKEKEIDFESFFKFSGVLFKMVFFDFKPLGVDAAWLDKIRHAAKILFTWFTMLIYLVADAMLIAYSVLLAPDLVEATSNVLIVSSNILVVFRLSTSIFHRQDIWKILEELREIFAVGRSQSAEFKVKKYLDDYHRIVKFYSGLFLFFLLPVLLPLLPFLSVGTMKLTANYWYPFDPYQPEFFGLALFWTNFVAYMCTMHTIATDCLLYAMISVVGMEFDIIKHDLAKFLLCPAHERSGRIKSLTERHEKLHRVVDHLQDVFGPTFLIFFLVVSFVLCFNLFQLSKATGVADYAFYGVFMGMIILHILVLCYFGQKLINSSEGVAAGIYDSCWEEIEDGSIRKQLMLMMRKSQSPTKLTAMNFFDVSLPSFSAVSRFQISDSSDLFRLISTDFKISILILFPLEKFILEG